MRRRVLEVGSALAAVAALLILLANATLVDRRPPTVSRVSLSAPSETDPKKGQTLTAIDIAFSEPVRTDTVEARFSIVPHVAGAITWDGTTQMIFTPAARLPADTGFTVTVAPGFEDLAGNAATAGLEAWAFSTLGPPAVTASEPETGAAQVAVDTAVRLTFDRLMDTSSVAASLSVQPAASYQVAWSGRDLTLTFGAPLAFGTPYTIRVGSAATDTDGSHLSAPYSTTFTTVAAGLSMLTTAPADGVAGISVRTPIAVVFDAGVDPTSVADALTITPSVAGDTKAVALPDDATPVPSGSAGPSDSASQPAERALLFTPSSPLAAHTTYSVTLAPTVKRAGDPNQVAAGRTWTFTTGQPTASAQNQVVFLSGRSGVRNLWLMNPDGTNPRQLTTELSPVTAFDVTADGQTLAISAGGAVQISRIDGTDPRSITGPSRFEYAPQFSPDGRSVVVGRRGVGGEDLGYWLVPIPGLGQGSERQLLPAGAPPIGSVELAGDGLPTSTTEPSSAWARRAAFSPDGRTLLLAAADGTLNLLDLSTNDAAPRLLDLRAHGSPTWSTGDDAFLIVATTAGQPAPAVWRIPPTGNPSRLFAGAGAVAADGAGARVTLQGLAGDLADPLHVVYVPAGGGPVAVLTATPTFVDREPSFSPDGQTVLFIRVRPDSPTRSTGIWAVRPDGKEIRQLTTDGSDARWLP